jgi:hypothetical protein
VQKKREVMLFKPHDDRFDVERAPSFLGIHYLKKPEIQ